MRWRPLSVRTKPDEAVEYDALHEGVPPWLRVALARWVVDALRDAPYGTDVVQTVHLLEQMLRMPLDWRHDLDSAVGQLANEVENDGSRALDIVDGCLMITSRWPGSWEAREQLKLILTVAGSAWQIVATDGHVPRLERRVDEAVELAARAEMSDGGNAGRHLAAAWHAVYGRTVNASSAYREAVRAVEAAAKPVITPSDSSATLGKMIRALRDKPTKWTTAIGTVTGLAAMMEALWTSQLDRHGSDDESAPLSVSPTQAEAAVHIAATLVHWFRSGHVTTAY